MVSRYRTFTGRLLVYFSPQVRKQHPIFCGSFLPVPPKKVVNFGSVFCLTRLKIVAPCPSAANTMKLTILKSLVFRTVMAILASAATTTKAQVILHPTTLKGMVEFSNVNPVILDLLKPPGNEGMIALTVEASSLPPAEYRDSTSDPFPALSPLSASYQVIVDSGTPGIDYSVMPRATLLGNNEVYYFKPGTNTSVTTGVIPAPLNFSECLGVVKVRFVDDLGSPVAVTSGMIVAYDSGSFEYTGSLAPLTSGTTEQHVFLRGGVSHFLNITVQRGTNYYTERTDTFVQTNVLVTCDDFTTVDVVLPSSQKLGTVAGTVKLLREFELTIQGDPSQAVQYSDYTSVIARYGPFNDQRWAEVLGVNFTVPASGLFTLSNVVPSSLDPASVGYQVYAQLAIRTNRNIQVFVTPGLGSGSNPPLAVGNSASLNLSNVFVIDPGYLRGRIKLQGPAESLGQTSLLRGMLHAGDDDADHNGIPDSIGTYGVYWSTIEALGVDRLATGATLTAADGVSYGDFPGNFNPLTSAYEGQFELAVGGLKGERSVWQEKYLSLTLSSGAVTNDNDYYYNVFYIEDKSTNDVEIVPGQPATNDVSYCFSEVKLQFNTTTGTFYNPNVRFSTGSFTGTNYLGAAAEYTVNLQAMYGSPSTVQSASNSGQVVMYLPEGTYTLYPSVSPATGTYAVTGLAPITLNVGCGQRISIQPCLQVSLNVPGASKLPQVHAIGAVNSCGNPVASITYTLNGGATQIICNNCGANPSFSFNLTLQGECTDNVLVVTATDANGGTSSITTTIHHDSTAPVIQCPADLMLTACGTNGAVGNFNVTATDNCPGPVTVVCTPPSGSIFPAGTNTVLCMASDAAGNLSQCSFQVIVLAGSQLGIQQAIILNWSCGSTLQSSDDPNGPWTDVPGAASPYAVAVGGVKKFYRVRN